MTILKFAEEYPDETSCRLHMVKTRNKEGIICKKCNSKKHYWLKAKWSWQCSQCNFRTSLRSGTMMENSNLPIRTWYLAMACSVFSITISQVLSILAIFFCWGRPLGKVKEVENFL